MDQPERAKKRKKELVNKHTKNEIHKINFLMK